MSLRKAGSPQNMRCYFPEEHKINPFRRRSLISVTHMFPYFHTNKFNLLMCHTKLGETVVHGYIPNIQVIASGCLEKEKAARSTVC
jgi:hypothetical protein